MKSLKHAAQTALDVQCACNLSGVVRSFAQITELLWEHARATNQGTEYVNRHPISRLFAEQISHLTGAGMGDSATYYAAHNACEALAASEEVS